MNERNIFDFARMSFPFFVGIFDLYLTSSFSVGLDRVGREIVYSFFPMTIIIYHCCFHI